MTVPSPDDADRSAADPPAPGPEEPNRDTEADRPADPVETGPTAELKTSTERASTAEANRAAEYKDPSSARAAGATDASGQLADVITNFHGPVVMGHGVVGKGAEITVRRETGRLSATDIAAALDHYRTPHRYDDALQALLEDCVVVLEGPVGVGKKAGAVSLLREVTEGKLYVLPPLLTLTELAGREYDSGCGYVVVDRIDEHRVVDTDFNWRRVRDKVSEDGAHLVVTTTTTRSRNETEAVRHVTWERPATLDVVRAHLAGADLPDTDSIVEQLLAAIPDECRMDTIAALAREVASGEDPKVALERFDIASMEQVRAWFEHPRSRREIAEVAVLAFIAGTTVRAFESILDRFLTILAKHLPPEKDPDKKEADTLPQSRGARGLEHELIRTERLTVGGASRRILVFKVDGYRRQVLAELWDRLEVPFWNAISVWLHEIVDWRDNAAVAEGLALFATVDFDEVEDSFLDPWSAGSAGWTGQVTATYVIWLMCYDESLAPVALRKTVEWVNKGNSFQRWTSAIAFSGKLGMRYPTEATRRLWQLITQSAAGAEDGCVALATLFANLVADGNDIGDAGSILTMLERQMQRFGKRGAEFRLMKYTMMSTLAVLSVRDSRSGHPALLRFLHKRPERAGLAAGLWAGVLTHRGYRRTSLVALWRGLSGLKHITTDPEREARLLGEALADALPVVEHEALKRDFMTVDAELRRGKGESLAKVLLAALDRLHRPKLEE